MINYDFVKLWYGKQLPRSFKEVVSWGINSMEIIKYISKDLQYNKSDKIKLEIDNTDLLPYFNEQNATIYYPGVMFTPTFYETMKVDENDNLLAFVAVYNGFQLHEALHILSPNFSDIRRFLHKVGWIDVGENNPETVMFCRLENLIEDIYIEDYALNRYPKIMPFLDITNDIMFSPRIDEVEQKFLSEPNLDGIMSNLIHFKIPKFRNRDVLKNDLKEFADILAKVLGENDKTKRLEITLELYEKLKSENEKEFEDKLDQINEQNDFEQAVEDFIDFLKQIKKEILDEINNSGQLTQEVYEIGQKVDNANEYQRAYDAQKTSENNKPSYQTTKHLRESRYDLTPKVNWNNFAQILKYQRQEKLDMQIPMSEGSGLLETEIHRLYTDGKIFSTNTHKTKGIGKPQIILLGDFSGSMSHLIDEVVSELYGLHMALRENAIPNAVFGHTTNSKCEVWGITRYDIKVKGDFEPSIKKAFKKSLNIEMGGNADGEAIDYVCQFFNHQIDGTKTLFVLSDGSPTSCSFGMDASNYLVKVIEKQRRKGINVFGISLVEEVIKRNNKFYGKDHNINASKNLGSELKKLTNLI